MATIQTAVFSDKTPAYLSQIPFGSNWPVVYIIDNDTEAYVGETLDASVRAAQHLQNPERQKLTKINIISDYDYNKSVILDLEAFLIKLMSVDGKFKLQNGNMGLRQHNYYKRDEYIEQFYNIWKQLINLSLATKSYEEIANSDEFKYSPYNSLSADQYATVADLISQLRCSLKNHKDFTAIIHGGPGTGKTVLAVHLMKLLHDREHGLQITDTGDDETVLELSENLKELPKDLKIGLVIPMQSLRTTLKKVFDHTPGLNSSMVISPMEVPSGPTYDLLIVDEAHRLRRRKALSQYPIFDDANNKLGLDESGTELDWILRKSKKHILFYDEFQSVKPADIPKNVFADLEKNDDTFVYNLHTQFRCQGGDKYIEYIRKMLDNQGIPTKESFDGYTLKLFDDCKKMTDAIHERDKEFGLCRTVAGYSWKWISKKDKKAFDIEIDNGKYRWNTVDRDWINHPGSIDEIGCIHTIQGYDLNYCAVIFGKEIDYDFKKQAFVINKTLYFDNLAKSVGNDKEALKQYVLNIYKTLLTRGIRGTYVYACNENMRKYLEQFIDY